MASVQNVKTKVLQAVKTHKMLAVRVGALKCFGCLGQTKGTG